MKDVNDESTIYWIDEEKNKMKPTFEQVQIALNIHAKKIGRSDGYTPVVIRDVVKAIQHNLNHHLKSIVLNALGIFRDVFARRRELLYEFCSSNLKRKKLAHTSGIDEKTIQKLINGVYDISDTNWSKLLNGFDKANKMAKGV